MEKTIDVKCKKEKILFFKSRRIRIIYILKWHVRLNSGYIRKSKKILNMHGKKEKTKKHMIFVDKVEIFKDLTKEQNCWDYLSHPKVYSFLLIVY